jgi:hypothetical protein
MEIEKTSKTRSNPTPSAIFVETPDFSGVFAFSGLVNGTTFES